MKILYTILALTGVSVGGGATLNYTGPPNDGWFETAGNWDTGSKPVDGDTIIIGSADKNYNVNLGNNKGDHVHTQMNITIHKGSVLSITTDDHKFANTVFHVAGANGLRFTGKTWWGIGDKVPEADRKPITFDLGSEGSVSYGTVNMPSTPSADGIRNTVQFNFTGTVSLLDSGDKKIESRLLLSVDKVEGGYELLDDAVSNVLKINIDTSTSDWFTDTNGNTTKWLGQNASLSTDNANIGDYTIVWKADANDPSKGGFYLEYVNGSFHSIPEPSTAMLSLLAFAGMVCRRRRKKN